MTVYVHLRRRLNSQGLTTEDELSRPYWSLWQSRRFPWGDLAPGDQVMLLDHWRDENRLAWEVAVTEAKHLRVESKAEAISQLSGIFGLPESELEDDVYLAAKADGRAVLLAWRAEPIRRLNLPRPAGLKIQRHGWGRLDDSEAQRLVAEASKLVTPLPALPPASTSTSGAIAGATLTLLQGSRPEESSLRGTA